MLKQLSSTRKCLVITATQANRKALDAKNIRPSMVADNIMKLADVDAIYGLSQTDEEQSSGVIRVSPMKLRHSGGDKMSKQVVVLQNLKMGQPILDSEYVYKK
jgi:hypothetical protein